ncbi:MAG: hypothetical protein H0S80_06150 [Desulfovibrionaceae bacterium]|nr:hypothetical protein [Desulfovibrionaceae bacterium]
MYSIEYQIEGGVVHARVCGVISTGSEAACKAREVVDSAIKSGIYRVLLDERELDISVDIHEIIAIAREFEDRHIAFYGGRVACLYRPEKKNLYKAYETIYQNRSLSYRLFDGRDQALAWLGE